jgi:hypothetical protein
VLEPGQHQLGIRCEGNWDDANQSPFRIKKERAVDVEPNKAYFFMAVVDESIESGGILLQDIQSRVTVDLIKQPEWVGRATIRSHRSRLTGELIAP